MGKSQTLTVLVLVLSVSGCWSVCPRDMMLELKNTFSYLNGVAVAGITGQAHSWCFDGDDFFGTLPMVSTFSMHTMHDLRSVSKSFVSILFGIALDKGLIESVDTPVMHYFPQYHTLHDSARMQITLRHLLTMSSGLAWDEDSFLYGDLRNSETAMYASDDPLFYVLNQSVSNPPGQIWRYSGGSVEVLAAVLATAVNQSLIDFSDAVLFRPMALEYQWRIRYGRPVAAAGLRLSLSGLLSVALMLANKGLHNGTRVVSEAWIREATTAQISIDSTYCNGSYGFFFWLGRTCDTSVPWVAALGNGGQRIWLLPTRNLVVVTLASAYNLFPLQSVKSLELLSLLLTWADEGCLTSSNTPPAAVGIATLVVLSAVLLLGVLYLLRDNRTLCRSAGVSVTHQQLLEVATRS